MADVSYTNIPMQSTGGYTTGYSTGVADVSYTNIPMQTQMIPVQQVQQQMETIMIQQPVVEMVPVQQVQQVVEMVPVQQPPLLVYQPQAPPSPPLKEKEKEPERERAAPRERERSAAVERTVRIEERVKMVRNRLHHMGDCSTPNCLLLFVLHPSAMLLPGCV